MGRAHRAAIEVKQGYACVDVKIHVTRLLSLQLCRVRGRFWQQTDHRRSGQQRKTTSMMSFLNPSVLDDDYQTKRHQAEGTATGEKWLVIGVARWRRTSGSSSDRGTAQRNVYRLGRIDRTPDPDTFENSFPSSLNKHISIAFSRKPSKRKQTSPKWLPLPTTPLPPAESSTTSRPCESRGLRRAAFLSHPR